MNVALCRISLRVYGARSLKDKRKTARSIIARVQNRFNVSVAEMDDNDLWQRLTLGVSCVSNDSRHANEVVSKVVEYISALRGETELLDYELEILNAF